MANTLEEIIQAWGDDVVRDIGAFLDTVNKTNTGELKKSLRFEVRKNGEVIEMELLSANYGEFVRLGVQGIGPGKNRAPKSPFKFGKAKGKGRQANGLTTAIDRWTIKKGLQGARNKKGQFIKRKSLVFLISRSIYRFGITPTNFVFPFFKRLDELTALIGKERAQEINDQLIKLFNNASK